MSLRINTNIAALNAHRNMIKTDNGLSKSLERLSSGLRINKAADDAAGMSIADALKAQANGLGQAIANANDGISVAQIADGALEESIGIVNSIRTKALQAATDVQNDASRAALQADIDKLLDEMGNIAETTQYNGKNLLDGTFVNKKIQIGAYSNQTVTFSISNANTTSVGTLDSLVTSSMSANVKVEDGGTSKFSNNYAGIEAYSATSSAEAGIGLNGVDLSQFLAQQGGDQLSAKGVAAAINTAADNTGGVKAAATTTVTGNTAITSGTLADGDLYINGVSIGTVTVQANDADNALVDTINKKTGETGVVASKDSQGKLTLTALDGRNIALGSGSGGKSAISTGSGNTSEILGGGTFDNSTVSDLTTLVDTEGNIDFYLDGVHVEVASAGAASLTAAAVDAYLNNLQAAGTISSDYAISSDTTVDTFTITRNDGLDINMFTTDDDLTINGINGASVTHAVASSANNSFVVNNSNEGSVTVTDDATVTFIGDSDLMTDFGIGSTTTVTSTSSGSIANAEVRTYEAAQITIDRADSALEQLDKIRSSIGSTQNQLESTVRNISVTQVNITSSESSIRDVDFAAESANFSKFQVLAQSGSFAMAQANASLQNVLRLLQ